jgi:hypothetical protein
MAEQVIDLERTLYKSMAVFKQVLLSINNRMVRWRGGTTVGIPRGDLRLLDNGWLRASSSQRFLRGLPI